MERENTSITHTRSLSPQSSIQPPNSFHPPRSVVLVMQIPNGIFLLFFLLPYICKLLTGKVGEQNKTKQKNMNKSPTEMSSIATLMASEKH